MKVANAIIRGVLDLMQYEDMVLKIPIESETYQKDSEFVIQTIIDILTEQKKCRNNKIIINTNLKMGLPLENINKIAGPIE